MLTRDVGDGHPQPVTASEMIAELILLTDRGHGKGAVADDAESQAFAAEVRRLNHDWKPGRVPRVPRQYRSPAVETARLALAPNTRARSALTPSGAPRARVRKRVITSGRAPP